MCCFSRTSPAGLFGRLLARPAKLAVSGTNIFARADGALQYLVYSMSLDTPSEVAMVLPLPVGRLGEDALEFIDLSGTPELFTQLAELFPMYEALAFSKSRGGGMQPQAKKLVVHQVGSFEASYVPSLADMSRLDERFRIPEEVWSQRPEYASYGFAVFKLKKGSKKIHPMAMKFATATPRSLFFPTVHVHDGELHERARFDHTLYYQITDGASPVLQVPDGTPAIALEATAPIQNCVPVMATRGVTAPDGRVFKLGLHGERANADTRVALT